jgi:hypothetical protein
MTPTGQEASEVFKYLSNPARREGARVGYGLGKR